MMGKYVKVSLGECCEIISGATPKISVEAYWDGELYWVTPKDLSNLGVPYIADTPRKITEAGLRSCAARLLPTGSVLLSSRAPIGHVAINKLPMATNQGFKSLIPDPLKVDAKYLYYWLRANRSYLESLGNGATFKEVSKEVVSRVEILLPEIMEQRRIAEALDQSEALRTKRRGTLFQLAELIHSIFLDMFGDPVRNTKNFPLVKLGGLTKIGNGSTPSRKSPEYFDGKIPWVKTAEVRGGLITDTEEKISEKARSVTRCKIYPRGSILIALYGQGKTRGKCAILGIDAATNQVCAVLSPSPAYETWFLFTQLDMAYLRLRALGRGGNQANLNLRMIADFEVILPPLDIQRNFAYCVETIEDLKASHRAHLVELDALFASLQYRAFRGEL